MSTPAAVQAALVSVGGSPDPVVHTLQAHRPPHVWYFCSAGSRVHADAIQAQLDWRPQSRFIEVERFEEIGYCYRELRRKIPEILAETKVPAAAVLVDYTGGTKTMSAALVLAASEHFERFSYVGGRERDKGGLGNTVGGSERPLLQPNPWSDLAIREVERARDLWEGCQFEAASKALRDVSARVPQSLRFEAVADVADAMAARHRLDFKVAKAMLGPLQGRLPLVFDGREDFGLVAFARSAKKIVEECSQPSASGGLLRELLDNTLRTAAQGRYEDAAARLYRAMEMQAQLWLTEATGVFKNGRCAPADVEKVPPALLELHFCKPDNEGGFRFSLEESFRALHRLGDTRAARVADDIALGTGSRWRAATEKRNSSILAHGVQPISSDGFERMKEIAADFLGFALTHQANPIPPLDARWLD